MLKVSLTVLRKLFRLLFLAGLASAVVYGVRALMGRISGEPGIPSTPGGRESGNGHGRGSFDSWPAVPQAPGRDTGTGTVGTAGTA